MAVIKVSSPIQPLPPIIKIGKTVYKVKK